MNTVLHNFHTDFKIGFLYLVVLKENTTATNNLNSQDLFSTQSENSTAFVFQSDKDQNVTDFNQMSEGLVGGTKGVEKNDFGHFRLLDCKKRLIKKLRRVGKSP